MLLRNLKLKNKFLIMTVITVLLVGFLGIFSTDGIYQSKKVIKSELDINKINIERSMASIEDIIKFRFDSVTAIKDLNNNPTAANYEEIRNTISKNYENFVKPLSTALELLDKEDFISLRSAIEE